MCDGRDLPWLQDTEELKVWDHWPHEYRDVIIVGTDTSSVGVYNLTNNDLSVPENYDALKQMFLDAASM